MPECHSRQVTTRWSPAAQSNRTGAERPAKPHRLAFRLCVGGKFATTGIPGSNGSDTAYDEPTRTGSGLALLKTPPGTGSFLRSPRSKNVPVPFSEVGFSTDPVGSRFRQHVLIDEDTLLGNDSRPHRPCVAVVGPGETGASRIRSGREARPEQGRRSDAIEIWRKLLKQSLSDSDRELANRALSTLEKK
jgi:hypothetical protein